MALISGGVPCVCTGGASAGVPDGAPMCCHCFKLSGQGWDSLFQVSRSRLGFYNIPSMNTPGNLDLTLP